jgi:hypothetical protein
MGKQYLTEGYDPTLDACITKDKLLQMIRAAVPTAPDVGFIIVSASVPNVGVNAELARFLWLDTATGGLKWYNGSSWQLVASNVTIVPGSISPGAIDPTGHGAYQILSIFSNGTTVDFQDLYTLIAGTNGLGLFTDITPGSGYSTQKFLMPTGQQCGVNPGGFPAKSITIDKVNGALGFVSGPEGLSAAPGKLLTADGIGGFYYSSPPTIAIPPKSISIQQLSGDDIDAGSTTPNIGDMMIVDSSGGMEWATPPAGLASGTQGIRPGTVRVAAFPGVGGQAVITHDFNPDTPSLVMVRMACQGSDEGFTTDDEINISALRTDDGDSAMLISVDNKEVTVTRTNNSNLLFRNKYSGASKNVNISQWMLKVYSWLLPTV